LAEYDQLDELTGHSHSVSLSGVPMRPKKVRTIEDAVDRLAVVLAESQGQLTQQLANALTYRPAAEPVKAARRPVSVVCHRNAAGAITGGRVSNGESEWDMKVIHRLGGHTSLDFTPQ
jgi:hypothetical protein